MKKPTFLILALIVLFIACTAEDCGTDGNKTAVKEAAETEKNQTVLLANQPPPKLTWSAERDNLIRRTKLFNDRTVYFYMYIFVEGVADPIGYYQVNKVSSVDSQLTNTDQLVHTSSGWVTLPSPSEDGSYGTNGDAVFGFSPEQIYLESNMHYIVSTVPLTFAKPVVRLNVINSPDSQQLLDKSKKVMGDQ